MQYALDVETIPNMDIVADMPEPEVKTGNLKDPEKIAEKVKQARKKAEDRMALSPLTGRVAAFSFWSPNHVEDDCLLDVGMDDNGERGLLCRLFGFLDNNLHMAITSMITFRLFGGASVLCESCLPPATPQLPESPLRRYPT